MTLIALIVWILTASAGLYLLSIWLIEYDKDFHAVTATRLPPAVLSAHVTLAFGGLLVWAAYLIFDQERLAWTAFAAVVVAASLGLFMAARWIGVYQAKQAFLRTNRAEEGRRLAVDPGQVAVLERAPHLGPPERNFPLPVVIAHGAFAAVTLTLVLLTVLGVGGS